MNPEVKKKWVKALRSGEYKQCYGQLKSCEGGFCFLGVLCDIYGKERGIEWEERSIGDASSWFIRPMLADADALSNGTVLPDKVEKWAELSNTARFNIPPYPDVDGKASTRLSGDISMMDVNDICKYSFEEIADLIEEQL